MNLKLSLRDLFICAFLITGTIIANVSIPIKAQGKLELTEVQKLKAENFKLKTQLFQCQVKIGNDQLTLEKIQLESEFRKTLGETNEKVFDWNSLSFNPGNK